ncbi:TlyA family RNA methyltransferase [Pseudalkalibacillus hwajinpoensis]|uniref:TlyA family RNA methyltransferase n=1 Tax=Guptibacillus hwajinpoensis TaxID=208199 RepID=A0A4U1MHX7_9BACL|nr:TlyA family RNA methyltransferase [Pseudalkalibacillus hwajinpoensis]TKD70056.1 TlyA family RNA methyltransferase [Pseudalkalibacillus hwajinpoensis]
MAKKERLDVILVNRGLIDTREKAKRAIMAGLVFSETERMDKPGMKVNEDITLQIKGDTLRYVGRGGLKLEKAIEVFSLEPENKVVLDIGSSTGGFTDCALQNGATLVYALDVGYNQLAWKLRVDDRVVVKERTNFRYSVKEDFDKGLPDLATIDVSFISLKLILPVLKGVLKENGEVVALVKPQFEAGRGEVGKKGIVRDKKVHLRVLKEMMNFATREGYQINGLSYSPITGGEGNIEFLLHLGWKQEMLTEDVPDPEEVVERAHQEF